MLVVTIDWSACGSGDKAIVDWVYWILFAQYVV